MEVYSTVRPPAQTVIVVAGLIMLGFPVFDWLDGVRRDFLDAASKVSQDPPEKKGTP